MNVRHRTMKTGIAAVAICLLAACSGGGVSHGVPATPVTSPTAGSLVPMTTSRFTITVPSANTATSNSRAPKYVSVNTQSVVITLASVNGAPFTGSATSPASIATNLIPSTACVSVGGVLTCTVNAPAIPGNDVYNIATYDQQQASTSPSAPLGNVLSQATNVLVNVTAAKATTVTTPLVLNGVVKSFALAKNINGNASDPHVLSTGTQASPAYSIVGSQSYSVGIVAEDASSAMMFGPGTPTFSSCQSGSSAITATTDGGTCIIQVKSFSTAPVMLTFTMSTGNVVIPFTTVQELWVGSTAGFVNGFIPGINAPIAGDEIIIGSPFAVAADASGNLWIANFFGSVVAAYSPGAGPIPIAADTITLGSGRSQGLAFDSSGHLWISQCTLASICEITAYVPGTNTPISADTIGPNANSAFFGIAFDANGKLWVTNGNTVQAYTPGTSTPIAFDTITGPGTSSTNFFGGIAFDAIGNLWVSDDTNNTVTPYVPGTSTPIAADTITTGLNQPFGIAFDAGGNLWVANSGNQTVTAYVLGTNTPISVDTINIQQPEALTFTP